MEIIGWELTLNLNLVIILTLNRRSPGGGGNPGNWSKPIFLSPSGSSSKGSGRKADTERHVNTRIRTKIRGNPLLVGVIIFPIILPFNTWSYLYTLLVINDQRCRWTVYLNSKPFKINLQCEKYTLIITGMRWSYNW